jgi:hypothetical protein
MRYMMLVYLEERELGEDARQACYEESVRLTNDLHARGQFIAASPLHPVATATTVRIRDGRKLVTDGPFAETREQLGGYFLVDAKDLDEALSIAARIPAAKFGSIEVRPLVELTGMPEPSEDHMVTRTARSSHGS